MTLTLASKNNRHNVNYRYKGQRHYELWYQIDVAQFKIKSISKSHIQVNLDWFCTDISNLRGFLVL